MCGRHFASIGTALAVVLCLASVAEAQVVFSSDFESGLPPELAGAGVRIEAVQGYAGLGAPGNQFGGSLLRYYTQTLYDTTLTLTDLPPHTHVSLGFLLALIDSWDGTELFQVDIDGQLVFSHWFQLATGDDTDYVAPAGGLLSSGGELGWSGGSWYSRDRAYDLSVEPAFRNIPHTADTLTVVWRMGAVSGGAAANWQGGADESWGIDNLTVTLDTGASAVPLSAAGTRLLGNAPNPFNPSTMIAYDLPAGGAEVRLDVHDVAGRLVRTLVDGTQPGGRQTAVWDGRGPDGRMQPAGLYFYRLVGDGVDITGKMMMVK